MATPLSAAAQLRAFKRWDVDYHEHTIDGVSWKSHNRNKVGSWGPVHGILWHHTADDAPDDLDFAVCWRGRSDLPGPLCQWGLRDDGTVDMIGNGRCNHAGAGGGQAVLDAVTNESYGDYPPAPQYHQGSPLPPAVDGNHAFYGFETYYSGGHKMTDAAYATGIRMCAAICEAHGWSAKSVIGHKEWSDWKIDPGNLDMAKARADIQAALDAGPNGGDPPPKDDPVKYPLIQRAQEQRAAANTALLAQVASLEVAVRAHPRWTYGAGLLAATKVELTRGRLAWAQLHGINHPKEK